MCILFFLTLVIFGDVLSVNGIRQQFKNEHVTGQPLRGTASMGAARTHEVRGFAGGDGVVYCFVGHHTYE